MKIFGEDALRHQIFTLQRMAAMRGVADKYNLMEVYRSGLAQSETERKNLWADTIQEVSRDLQTDRQTLVNEFMNFNHTRYSDIYRVADAAGVNIETAVKTLMGSSAPSIRIQATEGVLDSMGVSGLSRVADGNGKSFKLGQDGRLQLPERIVNMLGAVYMANPDMAELILGMYAASATAEGNNDPAAHYVTHMSKLGLSEAEALAFPIWLDSIGFGLDIKTYVSSRYDEIPGIESADELEQAALKFNEKFLGDKRVISTVSTGHTKVEDIIKSAYGSQTGLARLIEALGRVTGFAAGAVIPGEISAIIPYDLFSSSDEPIFSRLQREIESFMNGGRSGLGVVPTSLVNNVLSSA